ncbi:MAG: cytochrome c3 family protein [Anaerolineae bacterium]|nr:cytochrome c3 family protein [Anaerolineae bacterium]
MNEQRSPRRIRFRFLRRFLRIVVIIALGVTLVSVLGVTALWGHFWDFRVGDPTSESCESCHVLQSYVDSRSDPQMLASNHAAFNVDCVDCHQVGLEEQIHETIAYLQNDYQQPFVRAEYTMDTCFQCHEHGSYDQIAWRTTDLGVTDAQAGGHIANPHHPPHFSDLECYSCHQMHRPSTLLCSECHTYVFRFPFQSQ